MCTRQNTGGSKHGDNKSTKRMRSRDIPSISRHRKVVQMVLEVAVNDADYDNYCHTSDGCRSQYHPTVFEPTRYHVTQENGTRMFRVVRVSWTRSGRQCPTGDSSAVGPNRRPFRWPDAALSADMRDFAVVVQSATTESLSLSRVFLVHYLQLCFIRSEITWPLSWFTLLGKLECSGLSIGLLYIIMADYR